LSPEERIAELAPYGFSKRQARFLDLVMRHSGVCVQRQYASFASIVQGQKTRTLFAKLVRRGHASAFECRHNRGRVYHLHGHGLYAATDAMNSRYRRPVSASRTTERLMMLDALISSADVVWLATRAEFWNHFGVVVSTPPDGSQPRELRRSPVDGLCSDSMRVGVDPTGRTVLLYLVVPGGREDFRGFLARLVPILSCLPAWTLRLAFPRSLLEVYAAYQQIVRDEWERPLHPQTIDELTWYFERRRDLPPDRSPFPADARFDRAAAAFNGPRFDRLYRRWRRDGAAALGGAVVAAISEALATGSGCVEGFTLNHSYEHLSPVISPSVAMASAPSRHVDDIQSADQIPAEPAIQP